MAATPTVAKAAAVTVAAMVATPSAATAATPAMTATLSAAAATMPRAACCSSTPARARRAGSAQAQARSLIQFNQAHSGTPSASGIAGTAFAGLPGSNGGHFGTVRRGNPGTPGLLGQDRGGGLYLSPGGTVTLRNTIVTTNQATTGDPDISGTFSP